MSATDTPPTATPLETGRAHRVAMLVWNTFRHDARVRNEAETLPPRGIG